MLTKQQIAINRSWNELQGLILTSQPQHGITDTQWETLQAQHGAHIRALPPYPFGAAFIDEMMGFTRGMLLNSDDVKTLYPKLVEYFEKPSFVPSLAVFGVVPMATKRYIPSFSPVAWQRLPPPIELSKIPDPVPDEKLAEKEKRDLQQALGLNEHYVHVESKNQERMVPVFVCPKCKRVDQAYNIQRQNRAADEQTAAFQKCACGEEIK